MENISLFNKKADRAWHGSRYLPGLKAGVSRGKSDELDAEI